ncbi:uncharacterized protein LOC114724436 [Neltuma alba]|uniref:uncharacterized protein LOC114724436 n=1 Tax=Neltuma alba TaxID=207710 RepID=UPI0010A325E5|nr:uncharacterized protein LOC114724436 [Prosopis alba]
MERSLPLQLSEKESSPPHPDDNRSTKKVKIRQSQRDGEDDVAMITEDHGPSAGEENCLTNGPDETTMLVEHEPAESSEQGEKPSFRDKLLNKTPDSTPEDEFILEEGDVYVDKKGIFPAIAFSPRVHKILDESMRYTVVLKLLGRPIGYQRLRDNLLRLWRFANYFKLSDLEGGCFTATFTNAEDYHKALTDGPWVITGHYLTVHPWTPEFSPLHHSISQVVAWIRIPGLPTKYYKKNIIRAIGEILGQVIRIDYNTVSGERGKFARMAIILDLSTPLTSKITVDGKSLFVEYEGLPTICYHCGRYGHLTDTCPQKNQDQMTEDTAANHPKTNQVPVMRSPVADEVEETNPYGAWMQVPSSRRRPAREMKKQPDTGYLKNVNTGTRFDLLRETEDLHRNNSDCIEPTTENVNSLPVSTDSHPDTHPRLPKETKPKNATISPRTQKKHTSNPSNESLFTSKAYKESSSSTALDNSRHTAVTILNPKPPSKSPTNPKTLGSPGPTPKTTHHPGKNKENILPKPPDRTSPKLGLKIHPGLSIGSPKPKSKENQPTLADTALKAITKALGDQLSDNELSDDSFSDDESQKHSNMEC